MRNMVNKWLRPALATISIIVIFILLAAQFWGTGYDIGSPDIVRATPPLSIILIPAVIFLILLVGILMLASLIFGNRLAGSLAGIASFLFGLTGIYFGIYSLSTVTSDLFHVNGIIPVLGLIMGIAVIKRHYRHRPAAITGIVFCLPALVLDTIFNITYPAPRIWIIIATITIALVQRTFE